MRFWFFILCVHLTTEARATSSDDPFSEDFWRQRRGDEVDLLDDDRWWNMGGADRALTPKMASVDVNAPDALTKALRGDVSSPPSSPRFDITQFFSSDPPCPPEKATSNLVHSQPQIPFQAPSLSFASQASPLSFVSQSIAASYVPPPRLAGAVNLQLNLQLDLVALAQELGKRLQNSSSLNSSFAGAYQQIAQEPALPPTPRTVPVTIVSINEKRLSPIRPFVNFKPISSAFAAFPPLAVTAKKNRKRPRATPAPYPPSAPKWEQPNVDIEAGADNAFIAAAKAKIRKRPNIVRTELTEEEIEERMHEYPDDPECHCFLGKEEIPFDEDDRTEFTKIWAFNTLIRDKQNDYSGTLEGNPLIVKYLWIFEHMNVATRSDVHNATMAAWFKKCVGLEVKPNSFSQARSRMRNGKGNYFKTFIMVKPAPRGMDIREEARNKYAEVLAMEQHDPT